MGIGIVFVGVVAYIVVQAIVRGNSMERKNRKYGNSDHSADHYFFTGADPNIITGDSGSDDQGSHRHHDGHSGAGGHHGHSHGGSSWDSSGHHGGHGGWDGGGHGGHGGDSGGGGGGGD